jgi:hypothetical protein
MGKVKYAVTIVKVRNGLWQVRVNNVTYGSVSSKPAAEALADEARKHFAGK